MARTGRKPKPTAMHDLHGTGQTTRHRARQNEPVAEGDLSVPPDHLTADQKADWIYAVTHAPAGVLAACDQAAMEVFIVARDHHRIANKAQQQLDVGNALPLLTRTSEVIGKDGKVAGGGNIIPSPYLGIMSSAGQRMLRAAAELGFTPASRPRLSNALYDPALTPARIAPAAPQGRAPRSEPTGRDLDKLMGERETLN